MTEKQLLRKRLLAQRESLSEAQVEAASAKLAAQLWAHPLYQAAPTLYAYLSYRREVCTTPMIRRALADGKRVAVPKVFGSELRFFWIDETTRIEAGYRGIPEPVDAEPADEPEALLLLPGLGFDRDGHRMGYGGGFYDRYLAAHPHPTIALCFSFQLVERLPTEAHDLPADVVLTAEL